MRSFLTCHAGWQFLWVLLLCCSWITTTAAAQPTSADIAAEELPALMRQQTSGDTLRLGGIPLDKGRPSAALQLERFEVFSDDARIVVHGDGGETVLKPPKNAYYRGHVEDDPDSQVYLALLAKGGLRGVIKSAGQYWVVEGATANSRMATAPMLRQIDPRTEFSGRSFQCGNDRVKQIGYSEPRNMRAQEAATSTDEALQTQAASQLISHTARIAIETDWEFFQKFGNATAATDYIGDLVAYSSTLYGAEVDTSLLVSHISLWSTSSDPWVQTGTACGMFEFGRYWNNNRSSIQRTTAHFLSGKNNGGGIAWLGVLCAGSFTVNIGSSCSGLPSSSNYGGAYGYSGDLDGNFDLNNPGIVWDVVVFNHELGHNFNSPHTHCYAGIGGNFSPVDQCYGGESGSGCYSGTGSLPGPTGQGSGTLMSYCHLLSPGYGNLSFTFGEGHPYGVAPDRVPTRMSQYVASIATGNPTCLAPQKTLAVSGGTANEGAGTMTFNVTLKAAVPGGFTIKFATANGTATAGSDYTAATGTLTFAGTVNEVRTISVPILNNVTVESSETLVINFSNVSNPAVTFDTPVMGTITDNDSASLSVADVTVTEGTATATFNVKLSAAVQGGLTIKFATANGTATSGTDYTTTTGTLTFTGTVNEVRTISVPILNNVTVEPNETFVVNFNTVSKTGVTFDSQAIGTILNDDGPLLRINNVSKAEGSSGTTAFTFTVTLTPASSGTVTVKAASANGSATAGSDYTALPATTLTFAAGQTSKTVTVNATGNTVVEPNETFGVNLSGATGATIFDSQGLGTILNDDGPTLRINDVSKTEGNSGTTAFTFTVTLSPASTGTVKVTAATANGSALAGSDYTALASPLLTFSPGQTSKTVTVNATGNTVVEPNETFVVNLSGATGATIFDSQGVGTISNDD